MHNYCLKSKDKKKNKFWCATSVEGSQKTMKKWGYCTAKCLMDKECSK